jgi:hypothetical protein
MRFNQAMIAKLLCLSAMAGLPGAVLAQADRTQLAACYAIADVNARVACYDRLARPAQVSGSAAQSQVPELARADSFGQQQARIEVEEEQETLLATVVAISEVEPNKLQITLSNGQVWKQSVGKNFMLRKDDAVRITQSSWGSSFRLEKDGKPGYIQVLRLR